MLTVDLKENAVIRPLIEQGRQEGRQEGKQEGRQEGRRDLLLDQLNEKFGALPAWASTRVHAASSEQLELWARRLLHVNVIEDVLG